MAKDKYVKTLVIGIVAALVLEAALLGGVFVFLPQDHFNPAEATVKQVVGTAASPLGTDIIADTVARTSPAVVKIETIQESNAPIDPFFNDPFFRQFFGTPYFRVEPDVRKGLGSGFIISKDGYILTNAHVVDGATEINVYLSNKEKALTAKIIGSDAELDLAVLKVKAGGELPHLTLGDSDAARVGEWVIAIGNPYGLDHTVTTGVISAKGRPVQVENRHFKNLLQTDASINPGNSGGPLLNLAGQVIGINTAVNASAQGIGFAIPANTVKAVMDTLIEKGKISRPHMGVYIQTLTPELAQNLNLQADHGAIIAGVIPGSPADKVGLQQGDVILQINRQAVNEAGDVTDFIKKSKVGDKVVLLVERNGSRNYVSLTLAEK
ncbi:S1C family serine protease [Desulfoscipio geothermicus]|uniref:Do/DeqQ family serine protease n=1 Tax=Desulfoscipio geothermicus DSM 3669 TaxID=1121426 RepID=A0A1I6DP18_9FIRM|nr:trypsin-like peptidase domain-containing protein [Desulfoscipio geothermicus]SFR07166.1 Do/DeqQ family serine protease [Desulfoscipio geothermicus DSM 3669]